MALDSMVLTLSLALKCSPLSLEELPTARLMGMLAELVRRNKK